jgi:DNA-binding LytR/AlgR family response regulator
MKKKIFIKNGKFYHRLKINEVDYIFTEGNYSTFFTLGGKHIAKISLKQVSDIIPSEIFIRIHRNYIVRFEKIDSIDMQNNKVFINGESIPIGKTFKKALLGEFLLLS